MTVTVQISFCDIQSTVIIMSRQLVYDCYCPFVPLQCQIYGQHDVMTAGMTVDWPFVPLQCQIYSHHDVMTTGTTVNVYLFLYNFQSTIIMML